MQLGLQLPNTGPLAPSADLIQLARRAEAIGLDAVWVTDRLLNVTKIRPESLQGVRPRTIDPEAHYIDGLTTLAVVGGATERIRLGTRVLLPALRHPVVLAKEVAAIASMLGADRVVLGVGAGWMHEEFEAVGLDAADRFELLEESVALLRQAWGAGVTAFAGTHYNVVESGFHPVPDRPVPILIGGTSAGAIRRAARIGDGWVLRSVTPGPELRAQVTAMLADLNDACDEVGRNPADVPVYAALPVTAPIESFAVLAELGVHHCAIGLADESDLTTRRLEALVGDVTSQLG